MANIESLPYSNQHLTRSDDFWLAQFLISPHRKRLILRGARQVGKSFLVKQLARA